MTDLVISLETDSFDDRICNVLDADLLIFANGQDNGVDLFILVQSPNHHLCQIPRVDKLSQGLSGTGDNEGSFVL